MSLPSVLLVPALPVEAKAILSFFDDLDIKSTPDGVTYLTGKRKIFATKLGQELKERWSFLIASPTGAGNVEVSRTLQRLLRECKPSVAALIGCAGGFPERVEQFDVVVPQRVDYIARSKISESVEVRPQQEICSQVFVDHCKNVQLLDLWHGYLHPDITNRPINVHFEPIVCGETVLVNSRSPFYHSILGASPKAVAIEMESYGFLSVCREHRVDAAVLRGISDLLDNKNEPGEDGRPPLAGLDPAQYQATRHAAALFFATLDFIDTKVFSRRAEPVRKEVTQVSLIIDAEMHDVDQVQADLFQLFRKYGIRNFSFKPANSIRVGYEADSDAMRIYAALFQAGVVKSFGGFKLLDFSVSAGQPPSEALTRVLGLIESLKGATADDALRVLRLEDWVVQHPDLTRIIVGALEYQRREDDRAAQKQSRRILYARDEGREALLEKHFGRRSFPAVVLTKNGALTEELSGWEPEPPTSAFLGWFMGNLLDRDIKLDVLLSYSDQRLFYSWPSFSAVSAACNLPESAFVDACLDEWQSIPNTAYPTLIEVLDRERMDRLSRNQIRVALAGRPTTLAKAIQLVSLTCRILHQNSLPVKGCIIPSLDVLSFNGTIAADGAVERMLLTGMAGDLSRVAEETGLPLAAVRSAIRGGTLPHRAAAELAATLERLILKTTKLRASRTVLTPASKSTWKREAVELGQEAAQRYLKP